LNNSSIGQTCDIHNMKPVYFISDVHLSADRNHPLSNRETKLIQFLKTKGAQADAIYLVGDIFDFWFEYSSVIPRKYFTLLCHLRTLVSSGVRIEFITGNHDFWLESFFPDTLRIPVHRNAIDVNLNGKRYYIAHGDGLFRNERAYRFFKRIMQFKINIRLYQLLHPEIGFALANACSKLSRLYGNDKDRDADYIQVASSRFAEGYDGVIMGHAHRPLVYREQDHTYLNIGDWMTHFTYGKLEDGNLSLEYWPDEVRTSSTSAEER